MPIKSRKSKCGQSWGSLGVLRTRKQTFYVDLRLTFRETGAGVIQRSKGNRASQHLPGEDLPEGGRTSPANEYFQLRFAPQSDYGKKA